MNGMRGAGISSVHWYVRMREWPLIHTKGCSCIGEGSGMWVRISVDQCGARACEDNLTIPEFFFHRPPHRLYSFFLSLARGRNSVTR